MDLFSTPEQPSHLIAKDHKNRDVLFPIPNGEEILILVQIRSPSRWVINFFDWP